MASEMPLMSRLTLISTRSASIQRSSWRWTSFRNPYSVRLVGCVEFSKTHHSGFRGKARLRGLDAPEVTIGELVPSRPLDLIWLAVTGGLATSLAIGPVEPSPIAFRDVA